MTPFVRDPDFTLWQGDVLEVLRQLPDESVDCCVTSPPYWGLRDYQTDGQIGLEPTPAEFVQRMVDVFREVRRVLAPHGTCWVNLGDSYSASTRGAGGNGKQHSNAGSVLDDRSWSIPDGLKPKDLVGIPWRVAFALQDDGWWLRSDIVWSKPNPMPESVTDRPTKAHEYVFLLTKQPRYWFDAEAVREQSITNDQRRPYTSKGAWDMDGRPEHQRRGGQLRDTDATGRNIRSVWEMEQVGRPNGARHTLNDAYFDVIETEEQAYWLGFLYADGYLGRRHVDLQLAEKDHDHVLRFRAALGSSARVNEPRNGRSRVVISSQRMANRLRATGMDTRNRIPDMPAECVRHFVRGMFDGDGSIWSYLPAGRSKVRYAASMLGTERLLLQVRDLLGLRGKPKLDRGIHKIAIAAEDDIARLYTFLYDGATVYLARKRAEFPQEQGVSPDVWSIATQPYAEAHFATFPQELPRRCIKAGCPEWVCRTCGKARERIVVRNEIPVTPQAGEQRVRATGGAITGGTARSTLNSSGWGASTVGWSDCGHDNYRAGVVLDPFLGSGTTALVARELGRHSVGIELNPDYCRLAARRLSQLSLLAEGDAA